jgi:monofunctional biosynthetic peptidoglycan transglycosylase
VKQFLNKISRLLVKACLWFLGVSIALTLVYRFVPVPITILMMQRSVEQIANGDKLRLQKKWVSWSKISDNMKLAVIASEDQNFFNHSGFDFKAIEKATKFNEKQATKKKKRLRGASTISQQTAKNVFLFPARSWLRKGLEVYFTFLIELLWSKQRILEVYLNVIETGNGIYGVEAAANNYFNTTAKNLNKSQAAAIASIIPNPRKWSATAPSAYVIKRKSWILSQMNQVSLAE